MKRRALAVGAGAGVLAALVTTIAMVLLRTLAGVPLPLELGSDRFVPMLPVGTFLHLIDIMGGFVAGKRLGFFSFFLGQIGLGLVLGVAYVFLRSRIAGRKLLFAVGGAVLTGWIVSLAVLFPALPSSYVGLPLGWAAVVSALALLLLLALFAALLVGLTGFLSLERPGGEGLSRRALLTAAGGGVLALASGGLVKRLYDRSTIGYDGLTTRPPIDPVTPNDRFYVVTKNFVDPDVDSSLWRLELTGMIERPRTYDLDEVKGLPSTEQALTLECISNGVGGGLISNARWTGVSLRRLLEQAGVKDGVTHAFAQGVDGYGHSFSIEKALEPTTLLAYGMNGEALPRRHGFPLRLLVPGGYGEISVKWITRIELLDEAKEGFYEQQGWRAERVHTMSRIDHPGGVRKIQRGEQLPVSGIAFAGDRGISKVEVSTDGGRTWQDARIDYRGSRITWALWSYDWRPEREGVHMLVVRATDGEGELQTAEEDGINPDGATGYHHPRVRIAFA
jgi:DMSO/TMAO reductase YedYZ molybdopterin-dependent catalytic subunit